MYLYLIEVAGPLNHLDEIRIDEDSWRKYHPLNIWIGN